MNETDQDSVLTSKEVSQYLKLSKSTVYKLAHEGTLPGRKVGGTWRFSRKTLDEWLAQSKQENDKDASNV